MQACWRLDIAAGRRRTIVHKTMLVSVARRNAAALIVADFQFCIEASPKLNEIIACGRYCYRDLTKWPELNAMWFVLQPFFDPHANVSSQKKYEFFDRLINEFDLDEAAITKAAWQSGQMHALYSKYGLKPHFLDLYVQQFLGLLARFRVTDSYDHIAAIIGFSALLSHIVEIMNHAYAQATKEHRVAARIREENEDAA